MSQSRVSRRSVVQGMGALAGCSLLYQTVACKQPASPASREAAANTGPADYTVTIAVRPVELGANRIMSTTTYNGQSPGPLLRFTEGKR